MQEIITLIPFFALLGVCAGLMAGALGIGGGIILVPGIYYILSSLGYPAEINMHVAVGTSLGVIVPTGFSSARAHYLRNGVRTDLVLRISPGIVAGVIAGAVIADYMPGALLKSIFALALIFLAIIMVSRPDRLLQFDKEPGSFVNAITGSFIGFLSALMGIGGATMSVPYMTCFGIPIHKAVGTAAALGLVISVPGAAGYIITGLDESALPPFTIGYVSVPAWAMIAPLSVLMAPQGAKLAHSLPVELLRRIFAAFMVLVAMRMLAGVLYGY
jgi:uncharacterized membrane protein YfcA